MSVAITVQSLGKRYVLGQRDAPPSTLRDAIASALKAPFRRTRSTPGGDDDSIWALKDVSFEIREGEVVGIIGRNGSGKSTLLKILSRITEPTCGWAEIRGRVGSLLEVGTGFHPELTGRENVFVNGAILGMKRADIARRFDEIVAFAGFDRFIDTPVKFYSSGMQMRLAFSVAAHLEPDILLVDEVLAVGDVGFQKKCIGKMNDIAQQGRTVLFVSHDLAAVQVLCGSAVFLTGGEVGGMGAVADQIAKYLAEQTGMGEAGLAHPLPLSAGLTLHRFGFLPSPASSGHPAVFEIALEARDATRLDELAILVHDSLGRRVGVIDFRQPAGPYQLEAGARFDVVARLRTLPLVEGQYRIGLSLRNQLAHDILYDIVTLEVAMDPTVEFVPYRPEIRGVVAFEYRVETLRSATNSQACTTTVT